LALARPLTKPCYFFLKLEISLLRVFFEKKIKFSKRKIDKIDWNVLYLHRFSKKQPAKAGKHPQK